MSEGRRGRRRYWTDERIAEILVRYYLSNRKISLNGSRGAYSGLCRRRQRGEFGSVSEAIERLWFRGLALINICRAAEWMLDTILKGSPKDIKRLNRLATLERESVRKVIREIRGPNTLAARSILENFARTRRGKRIGVLMPERAPA